MSNNLSLGKQGEAIACKHLEKKGYRIRDRNWRSRIGEIDIIAEKGGALIFVEVKTRAGNAFGYPEEAITETKRRHLLRTAELYCTSRRVVQPCRIDAIAITMQGGGGGEVVHIEDITGIAP